jgi:predicted transcriptional regulator
MKLVDAYDETPIRYVDPGVCIPQFQKEYDKPLLRLAFAFAPRLRLLPRLGVEKTLEGVCSEHGVKSGTLAAQLKKLKENGVIRSLPEKDY